jgi:multiple sugar transport system substrate-binding protein
MFQAAADFATRPRNKTTGFYIESSLNGLAPFIYAGGGQVYDDATDPTSLAFSDDGSREALTETLEVLRDPQLTLTEGQLKRATPVEWFMRGKLGMLAGYRSLTPALREDPDLDFDVIPMPVLDGQATVGDITGLCISSKSPDISQTADFLVYAISEEAFGRVARAGYVVPANLQVAASEDFLQPTQMPEHAGVFNNSVRSMVLGPLIDNLPQLEQAVQSSISLLLTIPVIDDLEALTTQIDEESRVVLDSDFVPETPDPDSDSESEAP